MPRGLGGFGVSVAGGAPAEPEMAAAGETAWGSRRWGFQKRVAAAGP